MSGEPIVVVAGEGVFGRGLTSTAKTAAFEGSIVTSTFLSIGPFPGYGLLDEFGVSIASSATTGIRVAAVLSKNPTPDSVTFGVGTPLFGASNQIISRVPALCFRGASLASSTQHVVPLGVPVSSGSHWVGVGVRVGSSSILYVTCYARMSHAVQVKSNANGDGSSGAKFADAAVPAA